MPDAIEARLDGGTPLYAMIPPGARRGVVVIHEIFAFLDVGVPA